MAIQKLKSVNLSIDDYNLKQADKVEIQKSLKKLEF